MRVPVSNRDGGYGWVIVIAFFLIEVLIDGVRFSWGLFFVEFLDAFNRSKAETAWIGALMVGSYNLCGPIFAYIVNKVGYRKAGFIGSFITATGFILSFFAKSLYMLYFTYGILQGFGYGLVFLAGTVAVGQYFLTKRALAIGIAYCGSGVGTFVFPPLAKLLIETYTWRGTVFLLAGFTANLCVLLAFFRPFRFRDEKFWDDEKELKQMLRNYECDSQVMQNGQGKPESQGSPLLHTSLYMNNEQGEKKTSNSILTDSFAENTKSKHFPSTETPGHGTNHSLNMTVLSQSILGSNASFEYIMEKKQQDKIANGSNDSQSNRHEVKEYNEERFKNSVIEKMFPKALVTNINFLILMISSFFIGTPSFIPFSMLPDYAISVGLSAPASAWLLSSAGIGGTVSRVAAGFLSDIPCVHRLTLQGACLLVIGVTSIVAALFPVFEVLISYSTLYGVFFGAIYVVQPIVLLEYFGEQYISEVMGVMMCVYGVSNLIGSPVAGFIFDWTGSYTVSFLFVGLSFLLSCVINFMVLCTKSGKKARPMLVLDVETTKEQGNRKCSF